MGRKNRSSSINGGPSSSATTDSPSAANNNSQQQRNKQQGVSKEEILACHSLLSHFVHESSHHYGGAPVENGDGEQLLSFDQQHQQQYIGGNLKSSSSREKTPFLQAVTLAAAAASSSTCNNNDQQQHNINEINSRNYYSEKERRKMDGLYMMDKLLLRMREIDALHNVIVSNSAAAAAAVGGGKGGGGGDKRTTTTITSHVYQLMTTQNNESGYSPLHCAILHRDLFTLLLLLRHATMTVASTGASTTLANAASMNGASALDDDGTDNASLIHHPLRLLDDTNIIITNIINNNEYQLLINTISTITDNEGLTPLQLLGKTSSIQLEYCRDTLTWRSLMETRRLQQQQQQQQEMNSLLLSSSASNERSSSPSSSSSSGRRRRRFRRRMISFGDDRDYDSLQYDIELDNNNNGDEEEGRRRRSRGNSFNIDFDDDHYSDDDDEGEEEEDEGRGVDNDLRVLHDNVDFNVLADHDAIDDSDNDQRLPSQQQQQQQQQRGGGKRSLAHTTTTNDYGCEVLTFGRVDHCALGVPQLSSRIQKDDCGGNNNFFASSSTSFDSKTYKPKRVETFALGELRRHWSSSASLPPSSSSSSSIRRDRKNAIDSPAVAVAASTHHTLVMTRSGQLFSFGLGKGGRLGLGDESHRPLPTRILGSLSKRVVASIAAAENHSLCSTSDGAVFAWGSNGFGQLGIHSSRGDVVEKQSSHDGTNNAGGGGGGGSRLSPRRVEGDLKHSFVVSVACGERHSVALTRLGEVYCWGDNKKGQLGVINVSEMQSNGPRRVEGLWSAQPRRRAIAISAAAYSTLVLTMPPVVSAGASRGSSLASLPVNTIYGWGHGNHSPTRVVFPTGNSPSSSSSHNANVYSRMTCINPTAIACAKYHNVAITADGQVYTWGLHSDSLGVPQQPASTPKQKSRSNSLSGSPSSSSMISSPQLVVGMLPENGGGNAVAVSASESHTAICTSEGHLFTWGEADGIGHKGVRWQPSPRKVKRVHRAVGVAVAKEHTVLLMGTTFPPLPNAKHSDTDHLLSLQATAAIEISRNVDLFNVIPLALIAYRFNCRPLINFCDEFMRNNLDGVLAVAQKNDFDTFLSSRAIVGTGEYERDDVFHPFLHHLVNTKGWVYSGKALLKQYESILVPATKNKAEMNPIRREQKTSVTKTKKQKDIKEKGEKRNEMDEDNVLLTNTKKTPEVVPKVNLPDAVPTTGGKYHCDLCGISCPDSDSFTFHIVGRKHRNREMHAKAAEEKNVADTMMAMKRMQLVEKSGGDHATSRTALEGGANPIIKSKSTSAWGTHQTAFSGGLAPISPEKGKSFQDILREEQQKMPSNSGTNKRGMSSPRVGTKSPASQTPVTVKFDSILHSTPVASPIGASPTLGSFIDRKSERKHDAVSSVGASWGAKPDSSKSKNSNLSWGMKQQTATKPAMKQSPNKMKSFSEIQQEEEAIRNKEDHMCRIDGNQWFVQQRERAASIGEIQQQEQHDKEMLDLIEEQKQIEMEIMKSIKDKNNARKKQYRKKQQGHRRNRKTPTKKDQAKGPSPS